MDWARKWLADFDAEIIRLVLFDRSNNSDAIDENMYWLTLEEKSSYKVELSFSSKLDWGS